MNKLYIAPNTTIKILNNCPIDNTYEDTIYFASEASQQVYFNSLVKYALTSQSYQRVQRGKMRVEVKAENLYDCNYLMFQNTSFGSKWFYAFINNVEYINNITSEIEFEIDVLQTWMFDYELKECYVEREHSVTDVIGENLVDENLETGEYVCGEYSLPLDVDLYSTSIVVAATFDKDYRDGAFYASHVFSGLVYNVFENTAEGGAQAAEFIANAAEKTDGIVSVFLMPTYFIPEFNAPLNNHYSATFKKPYDDIGGYKPKNNKLFTYPYQFFYVNNMQGDEAIYKYEFFGDHYTFSLTFTGTISCNPSIILYPSEYKVFGGVVEKITLSGFPQLPYSTDTFKAWLAQNASSLAVNALCSAFSGFSGSIGGNILPFNPAALVTNIAQSMVQISKAQDAPNRSRGAQGGVDLISANLLTFRLYNKRITVEYAKMIDEFFNKFGYACHRVKVPNISSRPYWNYVKTIGCVATGSVPSDDMKKIKKIFDNGITFWKNGSYIGNYELDNSPTGG